MFNFMKIFCRQQAWILNSLPLLQQPSGKIVTSFNLNPFISDSIGLIHLSCEMKRDSLFYFVLCLDGSKRQIKNWHKPNLIRSLFLSNSESDNRVIKPSSEFTSLFETFLSTSSPWRKVTMNIEHPHHCRHFTRSFGNLAKISPEQQSSARAAASTMGPTMIRGPVWKFSGHSSWGWR